MELTQLIIKMFVGGVGIVFVLGIGNLIAWISDLDDEGSFLRRGVAGILIAAIVLIIIFFGMLVFYIVGDVILGWYL